MPDLAHSEFLHEILARPDDDRARLDFAQWLECRGDARGEFIRAQCVLARALAESPDRFDIEDRARQRISIADGLFDTQNRVDPQLEDRQRALFTSNRARWEAPIRRLVDRWAFRRGFVEEIVIGGRAFVKRADELIQCTPLRHLHIHRTAPAFFPTLLATHHLFRLETLELINCRIGPTGAVALALCPHLGRLEALGLCHGRIGAAGIRALSASPHLTHLRSLDLSDNDLPGDATRCIANSRWAEDLQSLNLSVNGLGSVGASAIAAMPQMGKLTRLILRGNAIGDDGACKLARSAFLLRLTHLDLAGNGITDRGVRALLDSEFTQRLRMLDLASNEIGDDGGVAFATTRCLNSLQSLILDGFQVGSMAARSLKMLEQRWGNRVSLILPRGKVRVRMPLDLLLERDNTE